MTTTQPREQLLEGEYWESDLPFPVLDNERFAESGQAYVSRVVVRRERLFDGWIPVENRGAFEYEGMSATFVVKRPQTVRELRWLRRERQLLKEADGLPAVRLAAHELYDRAGEQPGKAWLGVQLIRGDPLSVCRKDVIEKEDLWRFASGLFFALGGPDGTTGIHGRGVAHRDLSPSNVMIPWTEGCRDYLNPLLIDFGSGWHEHHPLLDERDVPVVSMPAYTPGFQPPETDWVEPPDSSLESVAAQDLYQWGMLVICAVTENPFSNRYHPRGYWKGTPEAVRRVEASLGLLPAALADAVRIALSAKPEDRDRGAIDELLRAAAPKTTADANTPSVLVSRVAELEVELASACKELVEVQKAKALLEPALAAALSKTEELSSLRDQLVEAQASARQLEERMQRWNRAAESAGGLDQLIRQQDAQGQKISELARALVKAQNESKRAKADDILHLHSQQTNKAAAQRIREMEAELTTQVRRVRELEGMVDQERSRAGNARSEANTRLDALTRQGHQLAAAEAKIGQLEERLAKRYDVSAKMQNKGENEHGQLRRLGEELAESRKQTTDVQAALDKASETIRRLRLQLEALRSDRDTGSQAELERQLRVAQAQARRGQELASQFQRLEEELNQSNKQAEDARSALANVVQQVRQLREQLHEARKLKAEPSYLSCAVLGLLLVTAYLSIVVWLGNRGFRVSKDAIVFSISLFAAASLIAKAVLSWFWTSSREQRHFGITALAVVLFVSLQSHGSVAAVSPALADGVDKVLPFEILRGPGPVTRELASLREFDVNVTRKFYNEATDSVGHTHAAFEVALTNRSRAAVDVSGGDESQIRLLVSGPIGQHHPVGIAPAEAEFVDLGDRLGVRPGRDDPDQVYALRPDAAGESRAVAGRTSSIYWTTEWGASSLDPDQAYGGPDAALDTLAFAIPPLTDGEGQAEIIGLAVFDDDGYLLGTALLSPMTDDWRDNPALWNFASADDVVHRNDLTAGDCFDDGDPRGAAIRLYVARVGCDSGSSPESIVVEATQIPDDPATVDQPNPGTVPDDESPARSSAYYAALVEEVTQRCEGRVVAPPPDTVRPADKVLCVKAVTD